jgi:hypothetical protein
MQEQWGGQYRHKCIPKNFPAAARLLEPFALAWIHLAEFQSMGPGFAFRLMRKQE